MMHQIAGDLSAERSYCMEVSWKLRNFLRMPARVNSILKSTSISLAKADWWLELFPHGSTVDNSEGYIGLYLYRRNFSFALQRVKATFSLKTSRGKNFESYSFSCVYGQSADAYGCSNFIARSQLEKKHFLLPQGTLTVHCEIKVEPTDNEVPGEESSEIGSSLERIETGVLPCQHLEASSQTEMPDACQKSGDLPRTSPSVQKLLTDYRTLLESKEDADVCLKVSDQEFRAHKCILRARSSVFSAMFKHDTKEKNSGEVVIDDLDPECFPEFLQHVYAGSVDSLSEENVFNLFIAADKYNMGDLKAECKRFMERTLSVDTFCDVMIMALGYKEDELLKVAIEFFCKNLTKIIVTVKWQRFSKEHNTEANELFIKALVPANEK